jgi:arsenate reductase-like glutaredoxin family protein
VSIEKMKADLSKLNDKIGQLQRKAKDMEERILQAENMEYLKIIRKNGISAEELQLMIDISNEEQKQILATREKEQTGNEEDT